MKKELICFIIVVSLKVEFLTCINSFIEHNHETGTVLAVLDVKRNKTLPPQLTNFNTMKFKCRDKML